MSAIVRGNTYALQSCCPELQSYFGALSGLRYVLRLRVSPQQVRTVIYWVTSSKSEQPLAPLFRIKPRNGIEPEEALTPSQEAWACP